MRNLLGRLHARDDADLARIAAFWRYPLAGPNRHQAIGALYRTMTDIRAVRDAWERLDPAQQAIVRLLAVADEGRGAPTLARLSDWLGAPRDAVRRDATHLYRTGILAREGDDQPLPVGEEPKLFLPRELTLLFRRLHDDLDAGDLSGFSLDILLERLDDAEIEAAATAWGLPAQPGLRDRAELGRRLLRRVGAPGARDRVVAALPADAARVWPRLLASAQPVPVAEAARDVGLGDDAARTGPRWRAALEALESTLLVWHTYAADGRLLFIPRDVRTPQRAATPEPPPLQIVLPVGEAPPWRHPHALAWDLLTLLRELAEPSAPPWPTSGEPARFRLRRLNHRLWWRGADQPPLGYLPSLLTLAHRGGLIRDEGAEAPAWRLTPAVRAWREESFAAQTEQLREWWLAAPDWFEGEARAALTVWNVAWPAARRQLLATLHDVASGSDATAWYALDSVAARIAALAPDLLGANFVAASSRNVPDDDEAARPATIAAMVEVELTTMVAWLGLVALRAVPEGPLAVRLRPAPDLAASAAAAPLAVAADGVITLRTPAPLQVWSLSAFAELEALGPESRYRLTEASLGRALAAGFDVAQVTGFLARQSGDELPAPVLEQLDAWTTGYRRVRVAPALWLTTDDPATLPALRELATEAGWQVATEIDGALVLRSTRPNTPAAPARARLIALLRAHGYAPLVQGD